MPHQESFFTTTDGLRLFQQTWQPESDAKASLVIVHGFGEHSGRYQNIVNALLPAGFAIFAFDHRGHGRSPGQRGHIHAWQDYINDLQQFVALTKGQQPASPLFLMGHSLGALIVLSYLLQHAAGLQGAIISGAPIQPSGVAKPVLVAVAKVFSKIWPALPVSFPLVPDALSNDKAVVQAYKNDPLVHHRTSVRWGAETLAAIDKINKVGKSIQLPMLFLHGADDPVNDASALQQFAASIAFPDTALHIYPQTKHEPHNDLHKELVLQHIQQWLQAHLV